jgi:hypothetical protein
MIPATAPGPLQEPRRERLCWALCLGARVAECRARRVAGGEQLRVTIDGAQWWVHEFVSPMLLGEAAEAHRRTFEAVGWVPRAYD